MPHANYTEAHGAYLLAEPLLGSENRRYTSSHAHWRNRAFVIELRADQSVVYIEHGHDVVRWYPDGYVDVRLPLVGGTPWHVWAPAGFHSYWSGTIQYTRDRGYFWCQDPTTKHSGYNKTREVVSVGRGVARFEINHDSAQLVSVTNGLPLMVPRIDKVKARAVSQKYQFTRFSAWLNSTLVLDEDAAARLLDEHKGTDYARALAALEQGDFATAARHMPLARNDGFARGSKWAPSVYTQLEYVSPSCADSLRAEAYAAEGVITREPMLSMAGSAYSTYRTNIRKYG